MAEVLKNDKRAIFTATSQAMKAHCYVMDTGMGTEANRSRLNLRKDQDRPRHPDEAALEAFFLVCENILGEAGKIPALISG